MSVRLRKIGNSTGVTFPKQILVEAGMKEGDTIKYQATEGKITVLKADDLRAPVIEAYRECVNRYRYTLQELAK